MADRHASECAIELALTSGELQTAREIENRLREDLANARGNYEGCQRELDRVRSECARYKRERDETVDCLIEVQTRIEADLAETRLALVKLYEVGILPGPNGHSALVSALVRDPEVGR